MTRFRNVVILSAGVIALDCHPEQASSALRGIWASRANRDEFTNDERTARLGHFRIAPRTKVTWVISPVPLWEKTQSGLTTRSVEIRNTFSQSRTRFVAIPCSSSEGLNSSKT